MRKQLLEDIYVGRYQEESAVSVDPKLPLRAQLREDIYSVKSRLDDTFDELER